MEREKLTENESVVRLDNLEKSFEINGEDVQILDGINLDIKKNEFIVCWRGAMRKNDIIKMIAGLKIYRWRNLHHNKKAVGFNEDVGMVYQTTALFPWLTVMGNVEFGPKHRGVSKPERRKKRNIILI